MELNSFEAEYFEGEKSPYFSYGTYPESLPKMKKFWEILEKKGLEIKEKKVLELGCAHGFFLKYLEEKNNSVYGIDASDYAVKKARELELKNIECSEIEKGLPDKWKDFDFVFSLDTIEHLKEPKVLIDAAFNSLKKNGVLLIVTPNKKTSRISIFLLGRVLKKLIGEEKTHQSLLTPKELEKLLSDFKIRQIETLFWGLELKPSPGLLDKAILGLGKLLKPFKLNTYPLVVAEKPS